MEDQNKVLLQIDKEKPTDSKERLQAYYEKWKEMTKKNAGNQKL